MLIVDLLSLSKADLSHFAYLAFSNVFQEIKVDIPIICNPVMEPSINLFFGFRFFACRRRMIRDHLLLFCHQSFSSR